MYREYYLSACGLALRQMGFFAVGASEHDESIDRNDASQSRKPLGFPKFGGPIMSRSVRKANEKDLAALKQILELNLAG
jgi:hypothetical protein